ncbi:MAG: F0F1 ATP synthase subunit epsilon [Nitrospinales bacterium]
MASDLIELTIVTPERLMMSDKVEQVNVPASEGDVGILPNHAPLLTAIRPGQLSYQNGENRIILVVSGGYLEVAENRVTVLAETAEFLNEIDRKRAETAKQKAEEILNRSDVSDDEFRRAQKKLFRAVARLESVEENK